MLGEYTCLQQMKVVNATNDNQCVNPAGEERRGEERRGEEAL